MTKASILFLAAFCSFLKIPCHGNDRKTEWESKTERILEADTIVVQQNWYTRTPIWDLPKRLKQGKRYNKRYEKPISYEETKELLNYLVYDESRDSRELHGCRGLFQVEFIKDDELVFGFGYAHGKSSAPISKEDESKILSYLDSKGFLTNDWIEKERMMEDANQAAHTTPASAPR
ncbi:hypothetical protein VDG1235_2138 [Verrucomicrobiia bacterium DG1235]|nr:hypothetical protein VDG1235_2138 [Verrucomicrobiae bacterium DG1235]